MLTAESVTRRYTVKGAEALRREPDRLFNKSIFVMRCCEESLNAEMGKRG